MISYLKKWTVMRAIYLVASIFIVTEGIQMGEWMIIILGGLFGLMALLNVSMCGPRGCTPPRQNYTRTSPHSMKDITYEEVK